MKITNIIIWLLRIIVLIFLIIIAMNNLQLVEFNLLGLIIIKLPLFFSLLLFLVLGFLLGIFYAYFKTVPLKLENYRLTKKLQVKEVEKEI